MMARKIDASQVASGKQGSPAVGSPVTTPGLMIPESESVHTGPFCYHTSLHKTEKEGRHLQMPKIENRLSHPRPEARGFGEGRGLRSRSRQASATRPQPCVMAIAAWALGPESSRLAGLTHALERTQKWPGVCRQHKCLYFFSQERLGMGHGAAGGSQATAGRSAPGAGGRLSFLREAPLGFSSKRNLLALHLHSSLSLLVSLMPCQPRGCPFDPSTRSGQGVNPLLF